MVRRIATIAGMVLLMLGLSGVAHADTSIDTVVSALETSPVYVSDEIDNAADIQSNLASMLSGNDKIVLVMVPKSATENPQQFAAQIVDDLGGYKVIGLAVGNSYVAYTPSNPTGAADMMRRAKAVSTSPSETLVTFVQNMRGYLANHPIPEPPPPPPPPPLPPTPFNWTPVWWGLGTVVILAIAGRIIYVRVQRKRRHGELLERFNKDMAQ